MFRKDGKVVVTKVDKKTFVGKNIIHVAVFKKKDDRTTYNMIYTNGVTKNSYMKRFHITSSTRRLKLRFKDKNKKNILCHTLNGSALALPRIVASILENKSFIGRIHIKIDRKIE